MKQSPSVKCKNVKSYFFQNWMLDCLLNSLLTFSFILSEPDWAGSSEEMESLLSFLETAARSDPEDEEPRGEIFLLASKSEMRVRTEGWSSGNLI